MLKRTTEMHFESIVEGDKTHVIEIALTLQRLVMEAGANRDFSLIHHDSAVAQSTGAKDVYANTFFLIGLFERLAREWGGLSARIKKIGPMRMKAFNCVGDVLKVQGIVREKNLQNKTIRLDMWIETDNGKTVTAEVVLLFPE